ncbi:MAG: 1-acyl-sn-glycerol-3-phosphate acyltransferase, partial [Burkholderiales bacterium]|nr:1-acyl-sn-glycerol-3-phosphate acyltransferase [Burkholderiales bacterium]
QQSRMRPAEAMAIGNALPRRDYGLLRRFGIWLLAQLGWQVEGEFPDEARLVVALAPHSSNWDFVIGASLMFVFGLRVSFIAKHTLFWWPLGSFMRWLGGIPVDRAQPEGLAETLAEEYRRRDRLLLAITPEGTRSAGARFKSGFYRVAQAHRCRCCRCISITAAGSPVSCRYCSPVRILLPALKPCAKC